MFKPKTESEEFSGWLHKRMKESDLTTSEISEFTRWLIAQSGDLAGKGHEDGNNSNVSFTEALQVVSWLKDRMTSIAIDEADRLELSRWLTAKLSDNSGLTAEELGRLHNELSNKF
jgi:hypothetical protein